MMHEQVLHIGKTNPVLVYAECVSRIRNLSVTATSLYQNHCGGTMYPIIEDLFFLEGAICFYVRLEPGDIAEVIIKYECF